MRLALLVCLVFAGCGVDQPDTEATSTLVVRRPATGSGDLDGNGTTENYMIGTFILNQSIVYTDANSNGLWDTGETISSASTRMTFDHSTAFRVFFDFTVRGNGGWTYANGLDLPNAVSGTLDFGVISRAVQPIYGSTVEMDNLVNYPSPVGG